MQEFDEKVNSEKQQFIVYFLVTISHLYEVQDIYSNTHMDSDVKLSSMFP